MVTPARAAMAVTRRVVEALGLEQLLRGLDQSARRLRAAGLLWFPCIDRRGGHVLSLVRGEWEDHI